MGAQVGEERAGPGSAVPDGGAALAAFWLWDVLMIVATLLTCVFVALEDSPVTARIGAGALVVAIAVAWPVAGRRMALEDRPVSPGRALYCLAIGAGLVAGIALVDSANWAAFVVYTQLFWLLPLAWAVGGVVALTVLAPLAGSVFREQGLVGALYPPQALFMTLFGVLVGVFITRLAHESGRRAELITELETSQAEVAQLSHVAGAAAERERLAGEIHDTLAQGFTSIVTLLQAAQAQFAADPAAASRHVELAIRSARENLQEARRLVAASVPGDLADRSLADAVERAALRFTEEGGVPARNAAAGIPRKVPAEIEIVLLRAAQELLANVRRHAGAGAVSVRLDYTDLGAVALTVTDDGTGFDPAGVGDARFGLRMMRTRVERLGGTVEVASGPTGTTVAVTVPTARIPQEA